MVSYLTKVKYKTSEELENTIREVEVLDEEGNIKEILEDSIADQDWSLNAGRYVGVVIEEDGLTSEEFKKQMFDLNAQLQELNKRAHSLENDIESNLKSLFGE